MKDIKEELQQRLAELKEERNKLSHRLAVLQEKQKAIELLMQEEDLRAQPQLSLPLSYTGHKAIGGTPFSRFIFKVLADGKPKTLKEIVKLAKNETLPFGKKNPGRVLHFTLAGLKQNDYTRVVSPGVWQLTAKAISRQSSNTANLHKEKATTVAGP